MSSAVPRAAARKAMQLTCGRGFRTDKLAPTIPGVRELELEGIGLVVEAEAQGVLQSSYPYLYAVPGSLRIGDVAVVLQQYKEIVLRYEALSRAIEHRHATGGEALHPRSSDCLLPCLHLAPVPLPFTPALLLAFLLPSNIITVHFPVIFTPSPLPAHPTCSSFQLTLLHLLRRSSG